MNSKSVRNVLLAVVLVLTVVAAPAAAGSVADAGSTDTDVQDGDVGTNDHEFCDDSVGLMCGGGSSCPHPYRYYC